MVESEARISCVPSVELSSMIRIWILGKREKISRKRGAMFLASL